MQEYKLLNEEFIRVVVDIESKEKFCAAQFMFGLVELEYRY